jgi:hypothetical protein
MVAGIIALALTGVGSALIIVGACVSLGDRKRRVAQNPELTAKASAGVDLAGLAKLADALGNKPVGFQMMIIGTALMLAGGVTGGVSSAS